MLAVIREGGVKSGVDIEIHSMTLPSKAITRRSLTLEVLNRIIFFAGRQKGRSVSKAKTAKRAENTQVIHEKCLIILNICSLFLNFGNLRDSGFPYLVFRL